MKTTSFSNSPLDAHATTMVDVRDEATRLIRQEVRDFSGRLLHVLLAVLTLVVVSARAQTFTSGSTGTYGPMNITADTTLDLPPDGIFHCTTINVAGGVTLRFNRNPLNTPVYLLATGDVLIDGTISVSGSPNDGQFPGKGGPGGFDGGFMRSVSGDIPPGEGQGPGGGKYDGFWAPGAFAAATIGGVMPYGSSLCIPLIGGSGGGGTDGGGGGGGGGALLIASSTTLTVNGALRSHGGLGGGLWWERNDLYHRANGSGGAIRLVAPVVGGRGYLRTDTPAPTGGATSRGRVRIDSLDRYSFRFLNYVEESATTGRYMVVIPATTPRLSILEAAGRVIPEGQASEVKVELPAGSSATQKVKVLARDFTNSPVLINVVVTPENGPTTTYPAQIDMADKPPQVSVDITLSPGIPTRIFAWTRPNP